MKQVLSVSSGSSHVITFFMGGDGEKGCVVLHGLSATPTVMKSVIDRLSTHGFQVNAPLLPGHGTCPEDLHGVKWEDWWAETLRAYEDLKFKNRNVCVVGLSLGSLLALKLAIDKKEGLAAAAVMGTPLVLKGVLEWLAYPITKYTPVRWFWRFVKKDWVQNVAEASGREFYRRHSYDKISIPSVLELFKLKKLVREGLKDIVSPVLALHGRYDEAAPVENLTLLEKEIPRPLFHSKVFERSKHIVTLDYDRETAAKEIVQFFGNCLGG